jgi:hypothetical protein
VKSPQDLVGVYGTTEVVLFPGPSLGIDPWLGTGRGSEPVVMRDRSAHERSLYRRVGLRKKSRIDPC